MTFTCVFHNGLGNQQENIPCLSVSFRLAGLLHSSSIFQDSLVSVGHFVVNIKTM